MDEDNLNNLIADKQRELGLLEIELDDSRNEIDKTLRHLVRLRHQVRKFEEKKASQEDEVSKLTSRLAAVEFETVGCRSDLETAKIEIENLKRNRQNLISFIEMIIQTLNDENEDWPVGVLAKKETKNLSAWLTDVYEDI